MNHTPQLPLALRAPPDQRLDAYLSAPAAAIAQLRALATQPGPACLYAEGASGSGKTHLALGSCAVASEAGARIAFVPVAAWAGRLQEALPALDADLIVLDGLEAIAGQRGEEVAIFDLHNRLMGGVGRLLYTARATPEALHLSLPDLRSRLSQCTRITLAAPDDALRRDILLDRAQRRGLMFDDAALDWLLRRAGRDLATLTTLLDRIDAASLAAQRRVTVPFLRTLLGEELAS